MTLTMVKATAEAHLHISGGPDGTFIANLAAKCKQEVDVTKKLRTLSIRRFFFPTKGRRKEKDTNLVNQDENKHYLLDDLSQEKVLNPDWEKLVSLPTDTDRNEWLATHTISFFEHINMLYGAISEFCTASECVAMTAPSNTQYQWVDEKGKKCKCAAPQYVEYVMTFIKKILHDETVFPTKYGNAFPGHFDQLIKKIHRFLFHVLAHIYQAHYKETVHLSIHPHLNTLFEHFMTFSREFQLVEEKETEILDDLYQKLHFGASSVQKSHSGSPASTLDSNRVTDSGEGGTDVVRPSDVNIHAVRPTSLGYGIQHKKHHSNGSCHSHPDDNKENLCDRPTTRSRPSSTASAAVLST